MSFRELLIKARNGDRDAVERLTDMYRSMIIRLSVINGEFSEDLYNSQIYIFQKCIMRFSFEKFTMNYIEEIERH